MRHAAHRLYLWLIEFLAASWWASWCLKRYSGWTARTVASWGHGWRAAAISGFAAIMLAGALMPGTPRPAGSHISVWSASNQPVPAMLKNRVPSPPPPPDVPKPSQVTVPAADRPAVPPMHKPSRTLPPPAPAAKPKPKPKPWKAKRAYDSVHPWAIPGSSPAVGGYLDGAFYWSAHEWSSFPHSKKIKITVFASTQYANTVDIEPGCATPAQARAWLVQRIRSGKHPNIVYTMRSQEDYVRWVLRGLKYYLWIADWTGYPHKVPHAHIVQWASTPTLDTSTIYSQRLYSELRR